MATRKYIIKKKQKNFFFFNVTIFKKDVEKILKTDVTEIHEICENNKQMFREIIFSITKKNYKFKLSCSLNNNNNKISIIVNEITLINE